MKKLYYFSKSSLQYKEVHNFKAKFALILSSAAFILSSVIFGLYFLFNTVLGHSGSYQSIKQENENLKSKLHEVISLYSRLENNLDSLTKVNNDLRISANLPPISDEERKVGVGGGYFDNAVDFIEDESGLNIKNALLYVDEVSRKIEFEKSEYLLIENKLKDNQRLFEAIPAIVPCNGTIADHGFGMRVHPILHIKKMHDGIDIITDVGTKVLSSGKGTVDYVGYRGGYGLTIEIDHGYGYRTIYAHLSKTSVSEGQLVTRGEQIANTGNSGLSSGHHLHYEIHHNGVKKNPNEFFFDDMGFFEIKNNKYSSIKK